MTNISQSQFTMEFITIDESTPELIPDKLRDLVNNYLNINECLAPETMRNDLFVILLYLMMIECDFNQVEQMSNGLIPIEPEQLLMLPQKLRNTHGMYTVKFTLSNAVDCVASLMVQPMGDAMLINLMLPELNVTTYSVCTPINKYIVNPFASKPSLIFHDLKDLSMKFKGSVAYPARSSILARYGYASSSIIGIPEDIRFKIFRMLRIQDLGNLARTCKFLRDTVNNNVLWERLFYRDFHGVCAIYTDDWIGNYKKEYLKKKQIKIKFNIRPFGRNNSPNALYSFNHPFWNMNQFGNY